MRCLWVGHLEWVFWVPRLRGNGVLESNLSGGSFWGLVRREPDVCGVGGEHGGWAQCHFVRCCVRWVGENVGSAGCCEGRELLAYRLSYKECSRVRICRGGVRWWVEG